MYVRKSRHIKKWMQGTFLLVIGGAFPVLALAQVMESTTYKIQFDSLNVGGSRSTSTSYIIEDTVGEVATGRSTSTTYKLQAGYQQMNEVFLSLSAAADVSLTPPLGGITGGTSNGLTTATATTDGAAGYELFIKASSSPALQSALDSFADYTPAGGDPDFAFTVVAGDAELGYSPEGSDIASRFRDNGSACNTSTGDTADACWDGLSTSDVVIARRTSANHPNGTATTIKFRAEITSSANKIAGTYTATSTLTLIAL